MPGWAWFLLLVGFGLFAWTVTEILKRGRGK